MTTMASHGGKYLVVGDSFIRSNDLCNFRRTAEAVAADLQDLAQLLVTTFGVPKVVICQVTGRQSTSYFSGIGLTEYSAAMDQVNQI